ncbi:NAD-dependent epimerase/dehydratase family protein [Burkholderiaceae bacterium FT117]|uniref:NAD-dependent epimerase/dehydratase family protein n=1 Tax=Zeimonas sediminis TaxID=2944268 RepID=UPI002342C997|nr:NAD-dependent epimerase/dehydratase family protein [Zeimonas sediminis]MCM5572385.1 NAD-dependent epimerase/dehydratase family protein [Zeimonas sediminis]
MVLKRILVTGASGFVGRAVCARLIEDGRAVTAGVRSADRRTVPGATLRPTGPIEAADWQRIVAGHDAVIHLAARVHRLAEDPQAARSAYLRENRDATLALARAAADAGVARLVFVSTIKVCGEATTNLPFDADCTPAPSDAYAESKLAAEQALREIEAGSAMQVAIVRPPLVYGPGVGANFLRLLGLVERGVPLPLASVRNRRSLVYVGNLADLVVRCVDHPAAAGRTFVASDGEDLSTPALISRIAFALGVEPRLWRCPPALLRAAAALLGRRAAADRLLGSLQVDPSAATTLLGWRPPFSSVEGLAATADWYRRRPSAGGTEDR